MRNDLDVILSCFQRLLAVLIPFLVNLFRLIDPFSFRRYLVIMTKFTKDEDGGFDDVPPIYIVAFNTLLSSAVRDDEA